MGVQNNGAKAWPVRCPICGQYYTLTNLMARRLYPSGRVSDTHEIGHMRRNGDTVKTQRREGEAVKTLSPIRSPRFRGQQGQDYGEAVDAD